MALGTGQKSKNKPKQNIKIKKKNSIKLKKYIDKNKDEKSS